MNAPLDAVLGRRDVWRGRRQDSAVTPVVASGHAELDALLPGGGWPLGALLEFCRSHDGLGALEWLMPALARLGSGGHWLAFVSPPYPLHAPALAQAGLAPQRCLVVSAPCATDPAAARRAAPAPWAAEQLLRGGAVAGVLLWWEGDDANTLRRLQLAAELGGALCALFRPEAAAARVSPAALRARVLPGPTLALFKCRGTHWHAGRPVALRLPAAPFEARAARAGSATIGAQCAGTGGAAPDRHRPAALDGRRREREQRQ